MKRSAKRLLPIFLCVVILCSIIWYLFIYDRGFMQDLLLGSARFFEEQGQHSVATWFYNQAYLQSDNDDTVVIELAERFKAEGNYTQAEIVLTNGIKDGGSPELYIALCKTYMEQDKLLDAVAMLENITNPKIKSQLELMRPATPVANPTPGYYSEYLNVDITSKDAAKLYVATGKDFPSLSQPYQDAIALQAGENYITAIAVGENGLVSEPAYFSYVVGGVIEEVTISDPVLDAHLREELGITPFEPLYSNDLWKITSLTVPADVQDYSDLKRLTYLETLIMDSPTIQSLRPISGLAFLKELVIHGCPLSSTDLSILASLPELQILTLSECSLSNISPLAGAKGLAALDLSGNAINDLSPIAYLEELTVLNLSSNAVTNLSALSALENLVVLDVSYNSLVSLEPLATCPALSSLSASNNQLTEIPLFNDPSVLTMLHLQENAIADVTVLENYTSLQKLDLSYNKISSITALAGLNKLNYLDVSHNSISKFPTWTADCQLIILKATHNKISSVKPLAVLEHLNSAYLDNNKITTIGAMKDCRRLVDVSVYGNNVWDAKILTDLGILVRYDPTK